MKKADRKAAAHALRAAAIVHRSDDAEHAAVTATQLESIATMLEAGRASPATIQRAVDALSDATRDWLGKNVRILELLLD